jgi:hypothetical protein
VPLTHLLLASFALIVSPFRPQAGPKERRSPGEEANAPSVIVAEFVR